MTRRELVICDHCQTEIPYLARRFEITDVSIARRLQDTDITGDYCSRDCLMAVVPEVNTDRLFNS